jgi:acetyltransferase-like isoleucine patch superfamily enzyme
MDYSRHIHRTGDEDGVYIGARTVVEQPCLIGKAPRGSRPGESPLFIGGDGTIRPFTTIYGGTTIGERFQTGQGVSIREDNIIGDDVSVGTNTVLEAGNRIGDRVRIHTGCFLELVTVEDDVFIAPNVVFADDLHPPCEHYHRCVGGAVVRRGARIGSNSTVLPGVVIGNGALVAAGSVVVSSVPDEAVVAGSPARVIKRIDELVCRSGFKQRPYGSERARIETEQCMQNQVVGAKHHEEP